MNTSMKAPEGCGLQDAWVYIHMKHDSGRVTSKINKCCIYMMERGDNMNIQVVTEDGCRQIEARKGKNLMKVLLAEGFTVPHPCDGKGKCKKCRVRIAPLHGDDKPEMNGRKQKTNEALACLVKIEEPLLVEIGKRSRKQRPKAILAQKQEQVTALLDKQQPVQTLQMILNQMKFRRVTTPFKRRTLQLDPLQPKSNGSAKVTHHGSHWERLMAACSPKAREILVRYVEPVLPHLGQLLTSKGGQLVMTTMDKQLIALHAGETPQTSLGFAAVCVAEEGPFASALLDLKNGHVLGSERASADETDKDFQEWMNQSMITLCKDGKRQAADVTDILLTGDGWFMERLSGLVGPEDEHMGKKPFIREVRALAANDLGLEAGPHAGLLVMPAASLQYGSAKLAERLIDTNLPLSEQERALAGTVCCLIDRGCRERMAEWAISDD